MRAVQSGAVMPLTFREASRMTEHQIRAWTYAFERANMPEIEEPTDGDTADSR